MDEIEERAIKIENEIINLRPQLVYWKAIRIGAIKSATEQKAIDIEKAKEAFNKACGWLAVYPWYNGVFEEFIKIIKE